jgi:phosphoribosyl 1,2-cyclic phosphodiesterase
MPLDWQALGPPRFSVDDGRACLAEICCHNSAFDQMGLELSILGSGSSGNASVLRSADGAVLIDAGLGPRTVAKRLANSGTLLADISAIVLTHLDSDHFSCNWVRTIVSRQIRVYVHASKEQNLLRITQSCPDAADFASLVVAFASSFEPLAYVSFSAISLAHDRDGSHGFIIEHAESSIGFATDLGRVPPILIERFTGVDILAIESNYDPQMQRTSGRPVYLQNRIMGGSGHLSNDQALSAVRAILDRCETTQRNLPAHVVLLHRSRQCNCPKLLTRLFSSDSRIAPRLTLADPIHPTPWLAPQPRNPVIGEQLRLMWS